jgi:hypothetical protein
MVLLALRRASERKASRMRLRRCAADDLVLPPSAGALTGDVGRARAGGEVWRSEVQNRFLIRSPAASRARSWRRLRRGPRRPAAWLTAIRHFG